MPAKERFQTNYAGVYYIESTTGETGRPERIYYIHYRRGGKLVEEKAGRQFQDDMTPARAAGIRADRMQGKQPSNQERREAARAAKEAEEGRWTIDKLWKEYRAQKPDSKALRTDTGRYENYIKASFGEKEPSALIQLELDRLRIGLLKKKSPQTVKHVLALLKRIIHFGEKKGLCQGPGFAVELPKVNNLKTEDLTPDQLGKLLEAIEKDEDPEAADLMKLALYTGMRRGELFKLNWEDIDFERGFIRIRDPKGGRDQMIPLNEAARQVLGNHPTAESPYVFPGRDGKQRVDIKRGVNRIKRAAGLPATFRALHGLRHVYASMLASSGQVDLYTLQKLLTHKSPAMTQRYAHLRDEALRRASNLAGDLINEVMAAKDKKTEVETAASDSLDIGG